MIDGGSPSVRGGVIFAGDSRYAVEQQHRRIERRRVRDRPRTSRRGGAARVGTGNVARKNCVWAGQQANITGTGLTSIDNLVADPLFVNRASHDYRLSTGACRR